MAHCTLTRYKSPAMCADRRAQCHLNTAFREKKKGHTKVDIFSKELQRVVVSMWSAMASQRGHQWHLENTSDCSHLRCEFRSQDALVREAECAKAPGGQGSGNDVKSPGTGRQRPPLLPQPCTAQGRPPRDARPVRGRGQTPAIGSGEQRGRPAGCSDRARSVI